MYFKIEKKSPLGIQLVDMWQRVLSSRKAIKELAKELSDLEDPKFFIAPNYLGGVLYAIQFKEHPGKQWAEIRNHGNYGQRFFDPSAREFKKKSELAQKWVSANDPISDREFSAMFGLKPGSCGSLTWYSRPGMQEAGDVFLLDITDEWALTINEKSDDMIEILASEYLKLKASKTLAP